MPNNSIAGVSIPDGKLAPLLFHHSTRVYLFGALAGLRKELRFDPELLYVGAMFHDIGLTSGYSSASERFEVDGANAALEFLLRHKVPREAIDVVWDAIALHTTPGIPRFKEPEVALVTAGVEMDVLGLGFAEFGDEQRKQIIAAHPRGDHFKERIIQAFFDGVKHKPETTFGNVKADVLERMDPNYKRINFCSVILESAWPD